MWHRFVVYSQYCFLSGLLKEVEEAGVEVYVYIQHSNDKSIVGMLFADDFVGVSDSKKS